MLTGWIHQARIFSLAMINHIKNKKGNQALL